MVVLKTIGYSMVDIFSSWSLKTIIYFENIWYFNFLYTTNRGRRHLAKEQAEDSTSKVLVFNSDTHEQDLKLCELIHLKWEFENSAWLP